MKHVAVSAQSSVVLAETPAEALYRLGPRTGGPVLKDGSIGRLRLCAGVGSNAEIVASNWLGGCSTLPFVSQRYIEFQTTAEFTK